MPPEGLPFLLHTGVETCSLLGGPNSLPRVLLCVLGDPTLFPGVPLSAQGIQGHIRGLPTPFPRPVLRGPILISDGPTLYSSCPPLCSESPYSFQRLSTSHGVLPWSWDVLAPFPGSHSLFPEVLLPARGMCSPCRSTLLPSQRLFPGVPLSVRAPLGSSSLPSGVPLCPGVPFSCQGESAPFWCGSRCSGRGTGVPPTRGAAAAARGGAGAGAGAHPRCRWRGGAAAPSAIKRAAAPVPQRGRGSP